MVLSKRKKDVDMLSGPIGKGLLTIALPIMVMNVVQSLFNIIDMTVLKQFGAEDAVGAIGASGTLISLITGLMVGISSGSNVVIARYIGQGNKERVERAIGASLLFSLLGGVLIAIIGISFAEIFLGWMNCPAELMDDAVLYFRLYFVGVPILMIYNFCAAILRSTGDSRRPMIYLTLGGVIKVLLSFMFVAAFNMTITGVAFATIISWAVSCALGIIALARNNSIARINFSKIALYPQELKDILFIGIPAGLQQALYSIANVIITAQVNSFGKAATTGVSIANTFDGILYQISVAPSLAVMPYVSQNIGNKNVKRATQSISRGMMITVILGAFFGSLSAIFSGQLSSIMTTSPEVIKFSQQKMMIISSTYFICGINEIMGASLRGMKRPMPAMVSTMIFMCAIRFVWVYLIFIPLKSSMSDPLTILYLIWPIGWILSIITLLCFYFPTVKKLKKDFAKETYRVSFATK